MTSLSALLCVDDFEEAASGILPKPILSFYKSGATQETTLRENREAFKRWYIKPRFLIDVTKSDLSTTILGHEVNIPFAAAPSGMQKLAHPEGERALAKAMIKNGSCYSLSTLSTVSIEDVALEGGLRLFQLYIYRDRNITASLVRRAEKAGFRALILTVDAPHFGIRYADKRNGFAMPNHLRFVNFPSTDSLSTTSEKLEGQTGLSAYVNSIFDPSVNWEDINWLKSITRLPIILKGILTAEDAIKGVEKGAAAIWVSNHGGRQLDGVLSTIDALPEIVRAVGDRCEVYVDGGFRTGTDIFKALAIGARMVFLGRPLLWGLTCGGFEGADRVVNLLKDELVNTMKLSGYPSVKSIKSDAVFQAFNSKI